jgi:hypothetical protein
MLRRSFERRLWRLRKKQRLELKLTPRPPRSTDSTCIRCGTGVLPDTAGPVGARCRCGGAGFVTEVVVEFGKLTSTAPACVLFAKRLAKAQFSAAWKRARSAAGYEMTLRELALLIEGGDVAPCMPLSRRCCRRPITCRSSGRCGSCP